mmetsp:Transcript_12560/g.24248  ORF Transcript_12560/g.24248 Transcript_12560/m.24248 type:complete len:462 (-) Transcript_12560:155-1540(-)
MKVAIQSGLKLASSARCDFAPPTAYQIRAKPTPCEFELSNGGSLHICNPREFAAVRELTGVSHDDFFGSLTRNELTGGNTEESGKSGSIFWYTADGRFVLKTVPEEELQTLLTMLPKYGRYLMEHRDSLLTRYFGAYRFTPARGGEVVRVVIMANVLEGARPHKVYDLKGTTEDRWVPEIQGKCMKDVNFESTTMYTSAQVQERLHAVLRDDTRFLERFHIMDYSLMLSIQYLNRETSMATNPKAPSKLMGGLEGIALSGSEHKACLFHIGIIDMLTTYDFKKLIAHTLKINTIGRFHDIDTEPPDVYAERFRKYFVRKIIAETEDVKDNALAQTVPVAVRAGQSQRTRACQITGPPSALPVDLLTFDATPAQTVSSNLASAASGHSAPALSAHTVDDLLDFDFAGGAPCRAGSVVRKSSAVAGAQVPVDLLCSDRASEYTKPLSAQVVPDLATMNFDLLA